MNRQFFAQKYFSLAVLCSMAMVAFEVTPWMAFFAFGLLVWKWGVEKYQWPVLARRWTGLLSVLLLVQVLVQYRTIIGQEPSYTLLVGLSALRVMDYGNDRDHKFVVLLSFILLSVKALFSIDIYWIVPSAFSFWGLWYALLPEQVSARGKTLLRIFALSIPLAVILFFGFPRVVMPWALSRGSTYGQIGFSDELNPGRVAEIAATTQLAFRAKIHQLPLRESRELYWRGSVLSTSQGLSWRPVRNRLNAEPEVPQEHGLTYEVAIEPTSQNFLFTLEGTRNVFMESGRVFSLGPSVFRSLRPLVSTTVYHGEWIKDFVDTNEATVRDLEVPELTGRVLAWVEETRRTHHSLEDRLQALQDFYSKNKFVYTIAPGVYGANGLEEFLFDRRRGFCEHFAGSYATLARALGIPARVVIGYQGGRYNPLGEFWKVAQKDAHAWVEVFHHGHWNRVDPTSWVAPLRLEIGAEEFFGLSEADQLAFAKSSDWRGKKDQQFLLWDRLTFFMEDMNYRWSYFLMDFDRTSQDSIWAALGKYKVFTVIGALFVVLLCLLLARGIFATRKNLSDEQRLLLMIEMWGRQNSLSRAAAEPPLQYLQRLEDAFPKLQQVLKAISRYYDLKMYAVAGSDQSAVELQKQWKKALREIE